MAETDTNVLLSELYRFLGCSLAYPRALWLDRPYLDGLAGLLDSLECGEELTEIRNQSTDLPELLESLQIEYTRLFINSVPETIAPPYGSVYRRGEGMLNSISTEKTRQFYRQQGFDLASSTDLADYLPLQLEFLALLLEEGRQDTAEEFLIVHFRPWFAVFRDRVRQGALLPFYRILVELIDFFTKEEEEYGYQGDQTEIPADRLAGRGFGASGPTGPG